MKKTALFILAVVILVMPLGLFGCTAVITDQEPGPPGEVVLRVGTTRPFTNTNRFSSYWYGVLTNLTTHDSLIKLGPDMQPTPWLVSEWEVSEDSTVFYFTVVDNARWHDDTPLTAQDVKFSIEYYRDRDPQAGWMKGVIESVEAEGNQVILSLTKPYGNLLTEFMTYSVVPEHIWANVEEPLKYEGDDRIIGSGPFALESWNPAAGKFIFVANENHFRGKPNVDRLEVHVFGNMDALVMALIKGDIDTWWDYSGEFPYTHIPPLLASGAVEFASATFLGVPAALGFNLEREPLDEIGFRQAVTHAINYEQISELIFYGYGTPPTYGFSPPTHPNHGDNVLHLEYNPTTAGALLDNIDIIDSTGDGWRDKDGVRIKLVLLTRSDMASMLRAAEMVAANLKAIGIDTTIQAVDSATWIATKNAKNYDLVFFRGTPWGMLMHAGHGSGYFDSRRTGAGVLFNLDDPEYLATCDARLATALPQQQAELDRRIQELHAELLPGFALVWINSVYPYRKGWDNWVVDHIYGGVVNSFSWFTVTKAQ